MPLPCYSFTGIGIPSEGEQRCPPFFIDLTHLPVLISLPRDRFTNP